VACFVAQRKLLTHLSFTSQKKITVVHSPVVSKAMLRYLCVQS